MAYEVLSAIASIGTFIVIGATAIAAMVQLKHLRASNQLSAVLNVYANKESAEMQQKFNFVARELAVKLNDPNFRAGLQSYMIDRSEHQELYVLDYFEQLGDFVKLRLVDENIILAPEAYRITKMWKLLEPAIAIMRRDGNDYFLAFEYLASRAVTYLADPKEQSQPPKPFRRLPVTDKWLAEDTARLKAPQIYGL